MKISRSSDMIWIILFAGIAVICFAIWHFNAHKASKSAVAIVKTEDKIIKEIDLDKVQEEYSFEVATSKGKNTVTVRHGEIEVTEADCPDKVCVRTGAIHNGAYPIVCLPHRLSITISESESDEVDSVMGK